MLGNRSRSVGGSTSIFSKASNSFSFMVFMVYFSPGVLQSDQSFTCWLIQTSHIVIERSPLNVLNLYNREEDKGKGGWGLLIQVTDAALGQQSRQQSVALRPPGLLPASKHKHRGSAELEREYQSCLPSFQSSATNLSADWCRSVATLSFRGSMFFISHSSAL